MFFPFVDFCSNKNNRLGFCRGVIFRRVAASPRGAMHEDRNPGVGQHFLRLTAKDQSAHAAMPMATINWLVASITAWLVTW